MKTAILSLHVIPKASKSAIIGWVAGADGQPVLKVRVAAPPEEGKANAELIRFLAREWDISKSSLEILSGQTSRHKRLKIHNPVLAARLSSIPVIKP